MPDSLRQTHNIPPVYDADSRILILGSFPSEKSRASEFFYGHPQNRFWRLLARLYGCDAPSTNDEKREFLLERRIALWDVLAECDISGSSDVSIKNVVPNDISCILGACDLRGIFTNGKTAHRLYERYLLPTCGISDVCLPSTSPANASFSMDRLAEAWHVILPTEV